MSKKSKQAMRDKADQDRLSTNGLLVGFCVHTTKPRKAIETVESDYATVSRAGDLHIFRRHELIRSFKPAHWKRALPGVRTRRQSRHDRSPCYLGVTAE